MIDRRLNYGRHLIKRFIASSTGSPGSTVLDLGAGRGIDLASARQCFPNASLLAVESWPPYIDELSTQGIKVFQINLEHDKVPMRDESVDVVVANQVLEHCKEIFWILSEAARVLHVGGSLVVGVPNLAALHNRVLLAFGGQPSCIRSVSAHVRGYTKSDLVDFMGSAFPGGMVLREFGGSNFYPFPPRVARVLADFLPSLATSIFLRFEKVKPYNGEFLQFPIDKRLETNFWLGVES